MIEAAIGILGAGLLAMAAWALTNINSLGNRVSVLEADKTGLREVIEAKLEAINIRLEHIEKKLDRAEDRHDNQQGKETR
jgi:hypothetical protein